MDFFPGFLDLKGRRCLVVGGGDVALRKARLLYRAGARLVVVAPETSSAFTAFIVRQGIVHAARRFAATDLDGCWLVVTATGRADVDAAVHAAASERRIFCNSVDDQANSSYITPAIVDRGPLVVAVSSGAAAPVLARTVRETIERMLPARFGRLAELAGRWRERVRAGLATVADRRRFWETLFDGNVPRLAIDGRDGEADAATADLLARFGEGGSEPGRAWLVGAGPGDADLLTLRALRILQTADVILYDRLVSDEVLALARRDADLESVGKKPGGAVTTQDEINARLISLVRAGKKVCRLKGGDPFVFGRGGEELAALQAAGLAAEVVPGITAAAGCAARAGIPLTHRDASQSVVLVSAHGKNSVDRLDWPSLARDRQTLVFYMAVARFPELMNRLIEHGRPASTPVAVVERGTLPDQRVIRGHLGQLQMIKEAQRIEPPAILIVGDVAAMGADHVVETVTAREPGHARGEAICVKQSV